MSTDILPYQEAIASSKTKFVGITNNEKTYDVESIFAMQMLMKNDFSLKTANSNPRSVRLAMINVASTGLTLNPANGYAYLVPRDGEIKLDISYKGLIKIATDTGSVEWARADLVYEADTFIYKGPAEKPEHHANPFSGNRGEVIGVYCIAKTHNGDVLTEIMDRAEIEKIRSKSTAFTKGQQGRKGPWEEWFDQMAKKAIIKRASKTWPYTDRSEKLGQAIEIANDAEGGYVLSSEQIGRPTDGAWEAMDGETQQWLLKLAAKVIDIFSADDGREQQDRDHDAWQAIEAEKLGADETIALWTQLGSKVRSAIKRAEKGGRQAVIEHQSE
jgi:recombination protein RecT